MKQPSKKISSEKENRKVSTKKQNKDNAVREGENNSIFKEDNDKENYPYKELHDKQFDNQPEFIDRNNDSKDKT